MQRSPQAEPPLKPWAGEALLNRPLYAFDLPGDLLRSLQLRSIDAIRESEEGQSSSPTPVLGGKDSGCAVCPGVAIQRNAGEVRSHLRSDWHRYNVGLSKRGQGEATVGEEDFHKLVEEVSSDDESDGDEEVAERAPLDTVTSLLRRLSVQTGDGEEHDASGTDDEGSMGGTSAVVAREPHLWFMTRPDGERTVVQTQFGIIRQVFPDMEASSAVAPSWHVEALQQMQCERLLSTAVTGIKRLKGARAADDAAKALGAVFLDASGEVGGVPEEDEGGESDEGEEDEEAEGTQAESGSVASFTRSLGLAQLRTWTFILLGGGDFSAITIALNPYEHFASKRKGTLERHFVVIARKQFHRYTTRRKQGGSQSAQDASGRFAKSAGANLRRYGEQQLGQEIRELLDSAKWRQAILGSERVWVRAGLRSARGVLWSWASGGAAHESPLEEMRKRDLVRTLPIATRKPTVGECLRCFSELTRVRIRHETGEEIEQRDAAYRAQLEGSRQAREERRRRQKEKLQRQVERQKANVAARAEGKTPRMDPIEQLRRERLIRLVEMLRKGRLDSAVRHLDKYEGELLGDGEQEPDDVDEAVLLAQRRINAPLPGWWRALDARAKGVVPGTEEGLANRQKLVPSTLLQLAAEGGHGDIVRYLLVDRKSDPTTPVGPPPHLDGSAAQSSIVFPHRTAYDLCSSREARDVFRRSLAAHPDLFNWSGMDGGGARVPKALTEEMEEARNKEEEVRDKRQLMRERARKRQEQEAAHTITEEDRVAAVGNPAKPKVAAAASSTSNKLGGTNSAPRALQRQRAEEAGLTPEMRARIDREKRARAAEERFRSLQGGGG